MDAGQESENDRRSDKSEPDNSYRDSEIVSRDVRAESFITETVEFTDICHSVSLCGISEERKEEQQ